MLDLSYSLLDLSSWCLVVFERLFLAVLWVCLRFVIVVFPDHTHYFYHVYIYKKNLFYTEGNIFWEHVIITLNSIPWLLLCSSEFFDSEDCLLTSKLSMAVSSSTFSVDI